MKLLNILLILAIVLAISSCQFQPRGSGRTSSAGAPTSATPPTGVVNPTRMTTETTTSIPVQKNPPIVSPESCLSANGQLPLLANLATPDNVPGVALTRQVDSSFGGGVVQSTEFTIELLLYCDTVFQPNSMEPYFISDIGGLAVYYNWRYDGTVENGSTYVFYGIDPYIRWYQVQGDPLIQGHVEHGRSTGIEFLPNTFPDFSTGVSLHFVYIIRGPSENLSGATLSFDLQQVSDGLQPSNVVVTPLSNTELESMDSIIDLIPTVTP